MVSHLVDGQDAAAHHLCLRGDEGGEDQPGTVAQEQVGTDVQGLEEGRGGEGRGGEGRGGEMFIIVQGTLSSLL